MKAIDFIIDQNYYYKAVAFSQDGRVAISTDRGLFLTDYEPRDSNHVDLYGPLLPNKAVTSLVWPHTRPELLLCGCDNGIVAVNVTTGTVRSGLYLLWHA